MARSTYIYIIIDSLDFPIGAFTVKHEAQAWWDQYGDSSYQAYRLKDGDPEAPSEKIEL